MVTVSKRAVASFNFHPAVLTWMRGALELLIPVQSAQEFANRTKIHEGDDFMKEAA